MINNELKFVLESEFLHEFFLKKIQLITLFTV
jgi:hypothetical protein